jgi:hypothetical protein
MRGQVSRMNSRNTKKKMADITKCTGEGCELKETCYRFTAPTWSYQFFFVTVPFSDGECDYYLENFNTND